MQKLSRSITLLTALIWFGLSFVLTAAHGQDVTAEERDLFNDEQVRTPLPKRESEPSGKKPELKKELQKPEIQRPEIHKPNLVRPVPPVKPAAKADTNLTKGFEEHLRAMRSRMELLEREKQELTELLSRKGDRTEEESAKQNSRMEELQRELQAVTIGIQSGEKFALMQREHQERREREAREIERHTDQQQRELREREGRDRPHHEPHTEEVARVRALHEAAERLAQSGLLDMAHELHRKAEQLEQEIHSRGRQEHRPQAEMSELMENMKQLREEVHQLHRKLDQVIDRLDAQHRKGERED